MSKRFESQQHILQESFFAKNYMFETIKKSELAHLSDTTVSPQPTGG